MDGVSGGGAGQGQRRPRVYCSWGFPEAGLSLLRERCDLRVWPGADPAPRQVLLQELAEAEGLFAMPPTDRLDREALAAAPHLRTVAGFGVGFDYVDVAEATRLGVLVCNTPGVLVEATADQAFALLLATARNTAAGDRYVRGGEWDSYKPALLLGYDLHGATLGIVGMGAIGAAVARRASGFGMRIIYYSRQRKPEVEAGTGATYAPLDELLRTADFVSVHTALTPETRGLIGARELALMKPTAILINTARGAVADEAALIAALQDRRIVGAGLDVFEREPLAKDSPLRKMEHVTLCPHLGSATFGTRAAMSRLAAENLLAGLFGQRPPNLVNPEAWGHRRTG